MTRPKGKVARRWMYIAAVCGLVSFVMWAVSETATVTDYSDCPPYDRCTPTGDWNDPNCKCWEK